MIVLIEGSDKAGKSTICKLIAERLDAEIIHCEKPKKPPFREYFDLIDKLPRDENFVIDRAWLSEIVYSELWRGGRTLDKGEHTFLEHFAMAKHSCVAIHAKADMSSILERMHRDGEELLQPNQVEKCLYLFELAFNESHFFRTNYLSDRMTAHEFMEKQYPIIEHVLRYQRLKGDN